jgi:pyruvate formate lyase activating enzyme
MTTALISSIHRFALDDGPGIRTTVFFKGCPLSCVWCHNPENIGLQPRIRFRAALCIDCGACTSVCPSATVGTHSRPPAPAADCRACGACADACPSSALSVVGRTYTVDNLVDILLRDAPLYRSSGGGVTFSGGEPGLFIPFIHEVCTRLKLARISTAMQTAGAFSHQLFAHHLAGLLDIVYFDLKLFDTETHRKYTGIDNRHILSTFTALARDPRFTLVASIPLIPGITATERNLRAIASFLKARGISRYELRGYFPAGITKREDLNMASEDELPDRALPREQVEHYRRLMRDFMNAGSRAVTAGHTTETADIAP